MSNEPLKRDASDDAEQKQSRADDLYQEACRAAGEGRFADAIELFTDSIGLDPHPAAYAERADALGALQLHEQAIADLDEALRLGGEPAEVLAARGWNWEQLGEFRKALADYEAAIEADVEFAQAYNNRAWVLATCPDDSLRDGKAALDDALTACELIEDDDAGFFDTFAAAYAEAGDFESAIQSQTKAIELADEDEQEDMEQRLELYRSGKPYRMADPRE
jgi:tetratricopeptide (TPR) repeat protein